MTVTIFRESSASPFQLPFAIFQKRIALWALEVLLATLFAESPRPGLFRRLAVAESLRISR